MENTSLWQSALSRSNLGVHRAFLDSALPILQNHFEFIAILGAGSLISGQMDEFSDIDLIIVVETSQYDSVMERRLQIAESLGPLLSGFTGEHVGEPRLIICLYGPPALHVDLKFVSLPDLAKRVEEPVILWQRDSRVTELLSQTRGVYPSPDWQWIEDRFWVWIHYGAAKVGRGELMDAMGLLAYLNQMVFGPLSLMEAGKKPNGLRHIERDAPQRLAELLAVQANHDAADCTRALRTAIALYQSLRSRANLPESFVAREAAERVAIEYLESLAS